jgi:hypothetical protein
MSFFRHLGSTKHSFTFKLFIRSVDRIFHSPVNSTDKTIELYQYSPSDPLVLHVTRHRHHYSTRVQLIEGDSVQFNETLIVECSLYKKKQQENFQPKLFQFILKSSSQEQIHQNYLQVNIDLAQFVSVDGRKVELTQAFPLTFHADKGEKEGKTVINGERNTGALLKLTIKASESGKVDSSESELIPPPSTSSDAVNSSFALSPPQPSHLDFKSYGTSFYSTNQGENGAIRGETIATGTFVLQSSIQEQNEERKEML